MSEEKKEELINKGEEVALNKKIAAITSKYFQALAKISAEEIYELAYTDKGEDSSRLLEIVNDAYTEMLEVGGDIPRGHFDHYKKVVADFNNTLVFNIDSKLEANQDTLIAKSTGKTDEPEKISHNDIIKALS